MHSGFILTSPVFVDGAGGAGAGASGIFVGDNSSHLYRVDSTIGSGTSGVVASGSLGVTGIDDSPIVDSSTGRVYVFERVNAGARAAIRQFTAGFGAATTGTETVVSTDATAPFSTFFTGSFDNIYYSGTGATGKMYVCSTNGAHAALWQIPLTATPGVLGTPVAGPTLTTVNVACSPIIEFYDGTTDRMFLSVTGSSVTGSPVNCTAGGGCIMSYDITTATSWGVTKGTSATAAAAGGTSAIIIDGSSTAGGASQVYFSPLAAGNCTLYWQGIGGCAIQTSQAGLSSPALVAPSITTQPANQTVLAGQTATFSVVAAGTAPLNYQWQKNGANIAGATSSSYTTPATVSTDSGATFRVVVTNSVNSATSNSATLTVTPWSRSASRRSRQIRRSLPDRPRRSP